MKNNQVTGVLRRVDDLGRIVLPKEYRRAMHINENDPLEIILCDNQIHIHKYHPLKTIQSLCKQYLRAFAQNCSAPVIICNTDSILEVRGVSLATTARLSEDVISLIHSGKQYSIQKDDPLNLLRDGNYQIDSLYPVTYGVEPAGAVILLHYRNLTELETGYAKFLADLLSQAIQEVA